MEKVLVVEDTDSLREVLATVLTCEGYQVSAAANAEDALKLYRENQFSLVLSDLKLPSKSGLDFLKESREIQSGVPVIVMTAYGSIDSAVQAMKLGATDFISKPFDPDTLCQQISQVLQHQRIVDRNGSKRHRRIITQSPKMENVLLQARKVAVLGTPVLLLGESGTGKELVARYIHEQSQRTDHEFVAVNCASMPGELLESEFFGHEAGSFTGATERRIGLFEIADKGTIFLDEIGNMPHQLQVKLLRALQESEVKRIGSNVVKKVDTRVISATNCNLEEEIKNGRFRDDLYYRLGVFVIEIPPLREHPEDIELLANYFIKRLSMDSHEEPRHLSKDALKLLCSYSWPGNIRELENAIERAMIFATGELTPDCFELCSANSRCTASERQSLPEIASIALKEAEIEAILKSLQETAGNKSKAAKLLGVSYKTLLNKIKDYDLGASQPSDQLDNHECL